ncbi:glutathione S-transferase family protein [Acanthopleuribacter pedis]|uniref:Glutathione S-transferase family protein n=1 Tax=Acanthopleuribacter pedis TaxID=442870 RepID=A0A8J7U8B5_9BACT|nr:glutathione S-transferase family protein [Acanthopleuribacter pedis]MBO1322356.1 glutathione S-transferase family protein [Acanthopleuribacter pedis]
MSDCTLYGSYTSPFVRHCRIVLLETGRPFEFEETNYDQSYANSPTKRVPFLRDGDLHYYDSSAILHHLRDKAGQKFLPTPADTELYALANTVLDTAVNIFLLERDGISEYQSDYIQRQKDRVQSGLKALDGTDLSFDGTPGDPILRIACLLAWAEYRKRFTFSQFGNLAVMMDEVGALDAFQQTAPPPQ